MITENDILRLFSLRSRLFEAINLSIRKGSASSNEEGAISVGIPGTEDDQYSIMVNTLSIPGDDAAYIFEGDSFKECLDKFESFIQETCVI